MMYLPRYFVIAVNDSHMGLGFADRSDSFDLNVSLQDHFKGLENTFSLKSSVIAQNFTKKSNSPFSSYQPQPQLYRVNHQVGYYILLTFNSLILGLV